jgi:hypothetical protein
MTTTIIGKKGPREIAFYDSIDPFLNSTFGTPSGYTGTMFSLRHDYPTSAPTPPAEYPWEKVTGSDTLTQAKSLAYVNALKAYVTPDMTKLLFDYEN